MKAAPGIQPQWKPAFWAYSVVRASSTRQVASAAREGAAEVLMIWEYLKNV